MKRRVFVGGAFAGVGLTGAYAKPAKMKSGGIPMKEYGKTGVKVSIIAQGGARMDLHPTVEEAAAHVRRVYDLGLTYFDCAHAYCTLYEIREVLERIYGSYREPVFF